MINNSHGKRMVPEYLIKKLLNGGYSAKLKDITNIQSLTDEQINELKAGDIVLKKTGNQTHAYIVSYKEENHGICISYFNAGYSETVSYDYTNGHWVYNSTDVCNQPHLYVLWFNVEDENMFISGAFYTNENILDLTVSNFETWVLQNLEKNFMGCFVGGGDTYSILKFRSNEDGFEIDLNDGSTSTGKITTFNTIFTSKIF